MAASVLLRRRRTGSRVFRTGASANSVSTSTPPAADVAGVRSDAVDKKSSDCNPATMGPQPPLPRPAAFRPTTAGSAVPPNRGSWVTAGLNSGAPLSGVPVARPCSLRPPRVLQCLPDSGHPEHHYIASFQRGEQVRYPSHEPALRHSWADRRPTVGNTLSRSDAERFAAQSTRRRIASNPSPRSAANRR